MEKNILESKDRRKNNNNNIENEDLVSRSVLNTKHF